MLRLILLLPLLVLLILFGLSNREEVLLRLWPLDLTWQVSLSAAVLLIAAAAFLFGAVIAWLSAIPYRRRARRLEATTRQLEAELAELRGTLARDVGPVPPAPGDAPRLQRPAA